MSDEAAENIHNPVLEAEITDCFRDVPAGIIVDATIGMGGHTERILESRNDIQVIGIDQDIEAIELASGRLKKFGDRVQIQHSNFAKIDDVLKAARTAKVSGIVADLGISSLQIDSTERGFSFRFDAPLDMRMDPSSNSPTAAELLAELSRDEIADIIYRFGEERFSRRIAGAITARREKGQPVQTARELARLIEGCVPRSRKERIHPATRTFQALRIAVNDELRSLEKFLKDAAGYIAENGKLVVITFHSLEDRIVKNAFLKFSGKCFCPPKIPQCVCGAKREFEILSRRPIIPGETEITQNPRARSAKLRIVRKLAVTNN